MEQEIGRHYFGKSGTKSMEKLGGELTNESDRIGNQNRFSRCRDVQLSYSCIERSKQLVSHIFTPASQGVKKRRLSCVCITHERNRRESVASSVLSVSFPHLLILFKSFQNFPLLFSQVAFHNFRIRFPNTDRTNAAGLTGKFHAHAENAWAHMADAGEFNLKACLRGRGVLGKNFENQIDTVPHLDLSRLQSIGKMKNLAGLQPIVHKEKCCPKRFSFFCKLRGLPSSNKRARMRRGSTLIAFNNHDAPVGFYKFLQLTQPLATLLRPHARRNKINKNSTHFC